jgi:hypothetical protein
VIASNLKDNITPTEYEVIGTQPKELFSDEYSK